MRPLVAITYAAGLARVPFALVEAAHLDGASSLQIVRQIILPVTRTHLLAASLLGFVAGVGNFGIPALLGLPVGFITLPTLIYREIASFGRGGIEDAALVSLIIAIMAGTAVAASAWLMARGTVRLEAGGSMEPFVGNGMATANDRSHVVDFPSGDRLSPDGLAVGHLSCPRLRGGSALGNRDPVAVHGSPLATIHGPARLRQFPGVCRRRGGVTCLSVDGTRLQSRSSFAAVPGSRSGVSSNCRSPFPGS